MDEDLLLEPLQRLARVEAELVDEPRARVLVGGERVGLPAGAVEREDQQPRRGSRAAGGRGRAPRARRRPRRDGRARDRLRGAARAQPGAAPRAGRSRCGRTPRTRTPQAAGRARARAPPAAASPASSAAPSAEQLAAPLEQAVEPRQVERARLDAEQIPGRPVSSMPWPSSLRSCETWTCTALTAVGGGCSPQRSSTSLAVGTSSFARSSSTASTDRCFAHPASAHGPRG